MKLATQTNAWRRERGEPLPEDWFRANGFNPCRTHNWKRPVEGCHYCARFHGEREEEVEIGGKRFRRYTPVTDADEVAAVAFKKDYRSSTRYGDNSLNTQMPTRYAPSAEDEYLNSIEINEDDVSNLVYSLDAEYGVYLDWYAKGATTREIAQQVDVSQSTAVRKLNRAKQALRVAANGGEHE